MEVPKHIFMMIMNQVADDCNGTTALLAKQILKADPKKVKLV